MYYITLMYNFYLGCNFIIKKVLEKKEVVLYYKTIHTMRNRCGNDFLLIEQIAHIHYLIIGTFAYGEVKKMTKSGTSEMQLAALRRPVTFEINKRAMGKIRAEPTKVGENYKREQAARTLCFAVRNGRERERERERGGEMGEGGRATVSRCTFLLKK